MKLQNGQKGDSKRIQGQIEMETARSEKDRSKKKAKEQIIQGSDILISEEYNDSENDDDVLINFDGVRQDPLVVGKSRHQSPISRGATARHSKAYTQRDNCTSDQTLGNSLKVLNNEV